MTTELIKEMNKQVQMEMYSGYYYLALSVKMEKENYKGYAAWLAKHYFEELAHACDIIKYMQSRNMPVELMDIPAVVVEETHPLAIAKLVYEHEQKVTRSIYQLHDVAKKADDYATEIFMHSFITEQIEEEDVAQSIIDKFTFAKDSQAALYAVDKEVGAMA